MTLIYSNTLLPFMSLSDEMKKLEIEYVFAPDQYIVVRLDGRNFSNWTKAMAAPHDARVAEALSHAVIGVADAIGGHAVMAYVNSDEASIVLKPDSVGGHWYGGRKAKLESTICSIFTVEFNKYLPKNVPATFDARAIGMGQENLEKYVMWRQDNCRLNFINMLAHHRFSNETLHGVKTSDRLLLLEAEGYKLDQYPDNALHGRFFGKTDEDLGFWVLEQSPDLRKDNTIVGELLATV